MAQTNATITQNLEKRVEALENDSVDETATLTQINKLYADVEIEVTFNYWLHRYHMCGTQTKGSTANTGASNTNYNVFCSTDLLL